MPPADPDSSYTDCLRPFMAQSAPHIQITTSGKLPGLPTRPLSKQQQSDALRRIQIQAEQRIKLGLKLFKAAEAHTQHQQDLLQCVQDEQNRIRGELQQDVAKSLHTYDQWVGQIDENFTKAIKDLDQKITSLHNKWDATQYRIELMMQRSEALLNEVRCITDQSTWPLSSAIPLQQPTEASPSPNDVTAN